MKTWLAKLTIGTYLTALTLGIVCHAMNFGTSAHPAMYYFVWDMFCGWSAHEVRYHLIAEGESGAYYRLSPAPWNTFAPYGDLERDQYDALGNTHHKIAMNTLRHTEHEPISRFFLVEETWPKKYNLPDHVWTERFDEVKDPHSYFWLKQTFSGEGVVLQSNPDFISYLTGLSITDNPRLKADSLRGKPFFAVDPAHRTASSGLPGGVYTGGDATWSRPSAN
jgi:hypothetical protein